MAGILTVRFAETEFYDINVDRDVVRFMATTGKGSYWAEVQSEGPRTLRSDRDKFKERAVEMIRAGADPCRIEMEETEQ